ncbi:hypothetical protein [Myxococcus sp. AM010]|uniref:hypothetical protein n=1 Tax=Myxococcus sp. AM010 TaxID=2745138 RepID=UPI0015963C16|nr:hypothetical protein [Myxococcus sp. AM010]NVJ17265.1 hypothetical protein [Myxococcus sp. AM010]
MRQNAIVPTVFFLTLLACSENREKLQGNSPAQAPAKALARAEPNGKLVQHKLLDDKFLEMATLPLPDNWILNNGKAAMSGPGNVNVYMFPMRTFVSSNDAMMQAAVRRSGGKMRAFTSIQDVIQQDLVPTAKKDGSKLVKQYDAPKIAASNKGFSDLLYKVGPMQQRFLARVTEWEDKHGAPYLIVVHLSATNLGNMVTWNYYCHALEAPKERYEESKDILLNALANTRYNPEYVRAYNQAEMARERGSWAAHNQRMQANKAAFEAQQRAFHEKNDAINQAIASNYAQGNAASDRNHHRFLNYIKDEETVRDAADGQRHQVRSGANQYWMNGNGQYVPSNNPNYDPNRDPSLNHQQWHEAPIEE